LAVQVAALRGQIRAINERLDEAGLRSGLNLTARFEDLAQTVASKMEAAAPCGPAAPYWIGLDRDTYAARLADLLAPGAMVPSIVMIHQEYGIAKTTARKVLAALRDEGLIVTTPRLGQLRRRQGSQGQLTRHQR
jgi:GntR family transcriptional regulator